MYRQRGSGCGYRRPARAKLWKFYRHFNSGNRADGGRLRVIPLAIFAICACSLNARAQTTESAPPASGTENNSSQTGTGSSLPPIVIKPAEKPRQAKRKKPAPQPSQATAQAAQTDAQHQAALQAAAIGSTNTPPLQQVPAVGKTGTQVGDIPASIKVIPAQTVAEQGGTNVTDAIRNVSGVNAGGPSTYGFFDRFSIRGLDARIYNDGFSEGDQLNGIPHSLNGVSQIEVLKGPGSALLGSGPAGGSINVVHYDPSPVALYGAGTQISEYGTISTNFFATGPTTVPGMNYRIDGLIDHSDGFRDQKSNSYEFLPEIQWTGDGHVVTVSVDLRHLERTPDPYGIVYGPDGKPINVSRDSKYYSPFAHGDQDIERVSLTDAYTVNQFLTINNRFSYTHRDVDILRNGAGGTLVTDSKTGVTSFTARQVRKQSDEIDDVNYMLEPVWKFATGSVRHTLVTGAQAEYVGIDTNRATADLTQNITNIFNPVVPETSTQGLNFLRDAKHSGFIDQLDATYLGLYAVDQIDVNDRLKIRLSGRQDWWQRELTPQIAGQTDPNSPSQQLTPGVTETSIDTPFSWSVGGLYKLFPGVSPFFGVSRSFLANFNSEAAANGITVPETALQYEAGVKFSGFNDRITLTTSAFQVTRDHVFGSTVDASGQESIFFSNQKTQGVEADLQVKPTAAWTIQANFTAQNAELLSQPSAPTTAGNRPIGIPDYIFNLWTTYDFDVAGVEGFRIGGGLSYNDKTYGNNLNTLYVPDSTVFDAVVSFNRPDWDISLGVKNLTDATYYTAALGAGGAIGLPRTVYLKANYRW
jgi:iron complex outermembrane receptor protein